MKLLGAGDPKIAAMTTTISQDLKAATGDDYAQPMINSDPDLQQWIATHPVVS
jgi:hypothetical protein